MSFYLGIDAGGTKTESAVSNGVELLGQAVVGSCKLSRVGEEEAAHNLRLAIINSCESARVSPKAIRRVCVGTTGASIAGVTAWMERVIHELVPGEVKVAGDHIIAHRAAFGDMPGVLVIAGTGSIAYGRNEKGETARAGGWGPVVSDEGSAFWIGREAVSAALREHDRASANGLLSTIAKCWKVTSPDELVKMANMERGAHFSELASAVADLADKGHATAQTVIARAGRELAELAGAVIMRLWPPNTVVRVALAGGVLHGSSLIRRTFQESIRATHSNAAVSFAYVRPVLGALALAAQQGARM